VCMCICVYICIYTMFIYICMFLYMSFIIHSLVVRNLGWFQSLATVNSMWRSLSYIDLHSFRYMPKSGRVEMLDHMAVLFLVFWGTSILISILVALTYIPTKGYEGSFFPAFSPAFI
jgi:hypothetical protein